MGKIGRTAFVGTVLGWAAAAAAQGGPPASPAAPPPAAAPPAATPRLATPDAFHAEIVRLYSMSAEQLQNKDGLTGQSSLLDNFWNMVKADRPTYLPMLRAELARTDNPAIFYFDGAELLRDASADRADWQLALGVIERLPRIPRGHYILAVNWYANHGFDTRRAAFRFLEQPEETIYVQTGFHFFSYSTVEAMVFSLFPMDENVFLGDLVARAQTATNDMELFALLHCIWAVATPESRAALRAFADNPARKREARDYAREMLTHESEGPMPTESAAELRAARREVLRNPFVHGGFERFHEISDRLARVVRAASS